LPALKRIDPAIPAKVGGLEKARAGAVRNARFF
jgi:hypothetical protein